LAPFASSTSIEPAGIGTRSIAIAVPDIVCANGFGAIASVGGVAVHAVSASKISALGLALGFIVSCASLPARLERFEYAQISMGVRARVELYAEDERSAIAAAHAAFARIDALDRTLSDYMPASELSELSARSGGEPVEVSADLYRVLERSIEIARASDGAFDVTVGPLVQLWRAARAIGELPSAAAIDDARSRVDWRAIELDPARRTARLAKRGMQLDVGAIGKGYAADAALETLREAGITRCLVALAGDIRVGDPPPGRDGWRIASSIPEASPGKPDGMTLADCGVSTSGDTEQFVEIGGARYSHIVDPRTGLGLTSRTCVTVIARDATTADALATAACVLGPSAGLALVARFDGATAVVAENTPDGTLRYPTSRFQRFLSRSGRDTLAHPVDGFP
jgi:thiamine biosynthesis lipoprotein